MKMKMQHVAVLAAGLCVSLPSCQQQQMQVQFLFYATLPVSEDSSTVVSVGKVEYTLQLLPEKAGVRVTSCYHPLYYDECREAGIPSGTFVLKDNAYGVEQKLRAVMKLGYNKYDVKHGADDIGGEAPYISFHFNDKQVYRSVMRFASSGSGLLFELNAACSKANRRELPAPASRARH